ncbi:unnamed protein product [Polarella glacialis]|uniref:Uncharacterized protein n=1 Tax=Polarella glacialis TaxID=89957 RepID=A0A813JGL5_POLGL|nr:unnamed protein product [Polarella glacialis]
MQLVSTWWMLGHQNIIVLYPLSPPGYKKAASAQMLMQAECSQLPTGENEKLLAPRGKLQNCKRYRAAGKRTFDVHLHRAKRATRDFFNASPNKALRECFKTL